MFHMQQRLAEHVEAARAESDCVSSRVWHVVQYFFGRIFYRNPSPGPEKCKNSVWSGKVASYPSHRVIFRPSRCLLAELLDGFRVLQHVTSGKVVERTTLCNFATDILL